MIKVFRFLAICAISVVLAMPATASAQTYLSIDFPGAIATTLNGGPNPEGTSVGTYTDASGVSHGFVLTRKGVFTSFDPPGSTATTPNLIDPQGVIVGSYLDASNVSHGFILDDGKFITVDFPGASGAALSGISPTGEMSGLSCVVASCASGVSHSFVVSRKGEFTSFDPPVAISSSTAAVSPSGTVFGDYTDAGGVGHGYVLDHGTFTTIDFPGSIFTFVGGGNFEGDSVGEYSDPAGDGHGFLLSRGVFTSFDFPGSTFTVATGINPGGIIVGAYLDSLGNQHGFIRTP
ncbi:MAG TPA: hypothetical protein VFR24_01600 [Candidatus Angelobacter sp.]|nr:hypothetical protein [Candidatus Angelobacter sp.]